MKLEEDIEFQRGLLMGPHGRAGRVADKVIGLWMLLNIVFFIYLGMS
jgi:hypothetical protein